MTVELTTGERPLSPLAATLSLTSHRNIVKVLRRLHSLHLPSNIKLLHVLPCVRHRRVSNIIRSQHLLRLQSLVELVDVVDGDDGESGFVSGITEGDSRAGGDLEGVDLFLGDVEGDGHGEEVAGGEAEGVTDTAQRKNSA